jgi:uncharacterized protein YdeI (YjbR/CyaY-like superfamily)
MEILFFQTPADFRTWLEANHDSTDELWVGFHKKGSGMPSMTWPEAVEVALCFGWIDSVRYSIDDTSYRQRFTPRRPGSVWSTVNVGSAQKLIEAGLMQPLGLEAFERRKEDLERRYSFEQAEVSLGDAYESEFRANAKAWAFWEAQPPGYRKTATWWVVSAKREATRRRRLATLIRDSEAGERIRMLRR